jgi:hypothetical protein
VVPEHLVRACLHDGTLTTPSVTPATSSVTRASAVLSAGEPIVPLLRGKWFSACAVESEFHRHSLSLVSLSILDIIFFFKEFQVVLLEAPLSNIHGKIGHVGDLKY